SQNKGSGNSASSELDSWVSQCNANKDILNLQVGEEGNTQSFQDLIKANINQVKQTYQRGTTQDCQWNKYPWEKGSCVREGIAEGVFYTGEAIGYVMAVGTAPLNLAISGIQSLFNQKPIHENIVNNFTSVQNGASNGARAVLNGIGTVAGAVINLNANAYNLVASIGQTAVGCFNGQPCSLDQIGNNYENNKNYLQDNFGYDMGDWKQNASIVAVTAAVVAATVFTGGLATTLVAGAIGAGAVATGVGLTTAFLVGNVLSYLGGSVMNGKLLDPKEFACGNKEANAVECVSYQGGQLLTGAILTEGIGLIIPKGTTKISGVTKSIDDLKKVPGYIDDVDDIKLKNGGSGTSTKVNIDGGEYLFDGEFYYKDGKTFLRVLDPDGSLSAAKGKMVEVNNYYSQKIAQHSYEKHASEFPNVKSSKDFKSLIDRIIENPSEKTILKNGKTLYWDDNTKSILIINPYDNLNGGTFFVPANGKQYYLDEIIKGNS
ncbi:hypothetical protein, partial [Arenimonas sp.]|uniref:hypothetical protein n=1 Tax=Arenimonas sp. TaxID=1872635 RepID=UPI0037BFAEB3